MIEIGIAIGVLIVLYTFYKSYTISVVVKEFEAGLLYRDGKFLRRLEAGKNIFFRIGTEVTVVDIRKRIETISGQEVLSADNVGLKASIVVCYEIENPESAIHNVKDYSESLYVLAQLALRSVVGSTNIDELLNKRDEIGKRLLSMVAPETEKIGLKLYSVEVRDIMFPGELKKIFAKVVEAQKEGLAALERARGEIAALRNLANAAKMMENNPALANLRLIQTLGNGGNTLVLGVPQGLITGKGRINNEESDSKSV